MGGGEHLNAPSLLADAAKGEIAFKHPTTNENISFKSDDYYQSIISEINNSIATCAKKTITLSTSSFESIGARRRNDEGIYVRCGEIVMLSRDSFTIRVTADTTASDAVAEAKAKGLRLLFNNGYGVSDISITEYGGSTYLTFNFAARLGFQGDIASGEVNDGMYLCISTFLWRPNTNELALKKNKFSRGDIIILKKLDD